MPGDWERGNMARSAALFAQSSYLWFVREFLNPWWPVIFLTRADQCRPENYRGCGEVCFCTWWFVQLHIEGNLQMLISSGQSHPLILNTLWERVLATRRIDGFSARCLPRAMCGLRTPCFRWTCKGRDMPYSDIFTALHRCKYRLHCGTSVNSKCDFGSTVVGFIVVVRDY